MRMANQLSFMNRFKQFNPFTRKNNGATVPSVEEPSFFNRINPFKKKNNYVNLPKTNVIVNNSTRKNNLRGGRKSKKSRR